MARELGEGSSETLGDLGLVRHHVILHAEFSAHLVHKGLDGLVYLSENRFKCWFLSLSGEGVGDAANLRKQPDADEGEGEQDDENRE